jgi:hypothetical protein
MEELNEERDCFITLIIMGIICLYTPGQMYSGPRGRGFLFDFPSYLTINFGRLTIELLAVGLIGFGIAYAVGKKVKK